MALSACADCLRALQLSSRHLSQNPRMVLIRRPRRAFSSRPLLFIPSNAANDASTPLTDPKKASDTATPPQHSSEETPKKDQLPLNLRAAAEIRKIASGATQTYFAYGATEEMYKECTKKAAYSMPKVADDEELPKTQDGEDLGIGGGWWHELGLQPTFSTWSQVTMLHVYLLTVRLRCLSREASTSWQQYLIDHLFYDAEQKMQIMHRMGMRGVRDKYLKDLFVQWRGLLVAYDEGITHGDPVLAAAVWRNVFKASEDVDLKGLAVVVSYMRRTLKELDDMSDEDFTSGKFSFGTPETELELVNRPAKLTTAKFPEDYGSVEGEKQ